MHGRAREGQKGAEGKKAREGLKELEAPDSVERTERRKLRKRRGGWELRALNAMPKRVRACAFCGRGVKGIRRTPGGPQAATGRYGERGRGTRWPKYGMAWRVHLGERELMGWSAVAAGEYAPAEGSIPRGWKLCCERELRGRRRKGRPGTLSS